MVTAVKCPSYHLEAALISNLVIGANRNVIIIMSDHFIEYHVGYRLSVSLVFLIDEIMPVS